MAENNKNRSREGREREINFYGLITVIVIIIMTGLGETVGIITVPITWLLIGFTSFFIGIKSVIDADDGE